MVLLDLVGLSAAGGGGGGLAAKVWLSLEAEEKYFLGAMSSKLLLCRHPWHGCGGVRSADAGVRGGFWGGGVGVGLSDIEMYSTGVKSLQTHMTDINFHHLPCLLHRKNRFPLSGLNT